MIAVRQTRIFCSTAGRDDSGDCDISKVPTEEDRQHGMQGWYHHPSGRPKERVKKGLSEHEELATVRSFCQPHRGAKIGKPTTM